MDNILFFFDLIIERRAMWIVWFIVPYPLFRLMLHGWALFLIHPFQLNILRLIVCIESVVAFLLWFHSDNGSTTFLNNHLCWMKYCCWHIMGNERKRIIVRSSSFLFVPDRVTQACCTPRRVFVYSIVWSRSTSSLVLTCPVSIILNFHWKRRLLFEKVERSVLL